MNHLIVAYPYIGSVLLMLTIGCLVYVFFFAKPYAYRYSLTSFIHSVSPRTFPLSFLLQLLRGLILIMLAFLAARPQWQDVSSPVAVEGIDIMLVLDISGSMRLLDDVRDQRARITVAKQEALSFIEKRTHDQIGVVVFGNEAFSKVPLTLDKSLLKEALSSVAIGDVDEAGTVLITALATAINRLRHSTAKSKVIVALTDGIPSSDDIDAQLVLSLAKQYGIKIYTVGIGSNTVAYFPDAFGRLHQEKTYVDEVLLKKLADESGGVYFRAHKPSEVTAAYTHIDTLEKKEYQTTLFYPVYEAYTFFIWVLVFLIVLEFLMRFWWWRGI